MSQIASNLQIDSARLWDTIHETAKLGMTPISLRRDVLATSEIVLALAGIAS